MSKSYTIISVKSTGNNTNKGKKQNPLKLINKLGFVHAAFPFN